ncbi:RNA polymerase-binding protein DksA [Pseudomonas sp. 5P_3.1_Bac2]|uniref:RNA polymerase-binding protein DksA n=1 Tax=Pseudomonas sp. 5P_3.1_Bac2 TaxID=2971617 RepID=UPI0021C6271D|nr:RNA polymerase-binding protein DksA [Pseudomonas sp. 5P_3.1_Bac2]MCU1719181.1 RNA polymerase-binding protein DksA [Pseudomonas sp. 5P_3.1_Bac2]
MNAQASLTVAELLAQPAADYMNPTQQEFFRQLLHRERSELMQRIEEQMLSLREAEPHSDVADIGSAQEQQQWQLRLLEREKKLLDKIDQALERLARGEYGWCTATGEAIGLPRLLLRPTASLCIEAKERQEQREKHQRQA